MHWGMINLFEKWLHALSYESNTVVNNEQMMRDEFFLKILNIK